MCDNTVNQVYQTKLSSIKSIPSKRVWRGDINITDFHIFNKKIHDKVYSNILKYGKNLKEAEKLIMISKIVVSTAILFHDNKSKIKDTTFNKEVESLDSNKPDIFSKCPDDVVKTHYSASLGSKMFEKNRIIIEGDIKYHTIIDNIIHEIIMSKRGKSTDCFCLSYDLFKIMLFNISNIS